MHLHKIFYALNEMMTEPYLGKVLEKCEETVHVLILNYMPNDRFIVHELMQQIIVNSQQICRISLTRVAG
ncbi:hypothetical protein FXV74_03730 [Latilactobacillus sakei]|nr:hypothetical protein FXV74_03730 [Latilactobacillus sakei]UNC23003.1 hypothetical protein FX989_03470 [Latilactobacillus sakei]